MVMMIILMIVIKPLLIKKINLGENSQLICQKIRLMKVINRKMNLGENNETQGMNNNMSVIYLFYLMVDIKKIILLWIIQNQILHKNIHNFI